MPAARGGVNAAAGPHQPDQLYRRAMGRGFRVELRGPEPTTYSMGGNPDVGTLEQITMLDNSGNPISAATIESGSFLWFQTLGSACGVNQNPC